MASEFLDGQQRVMTQALYPFGKLGRGNSRAVLKPIQNQPGGTHQDIIEYEIQMFPLVAWELQLPLIQDTFAHTVQNLADEIRVSMGAQENTDNVAVHFD